MHNDLVAMSVTRYVRSADGGRVACSVEGEGPVDILLLNESVLPMEALRENSHTSAFLRRLRSWGRVIVFDRRGVGLSDPITSPDGPRLDDWTSDAVAVLDAAGSRRAAVLSFGPSSGLIAMMLASRYPNRVASLSLYDAIARYRWAPDYLHGVTEADEQLIAAGIRADWGTPHWSDRRRRFAATAERDPVFAEWATLWLRRGASPHEIAAQTDAVRSSDVRAELTGIACPTLVINHAEVGDGHYLAAHIPNSRYVELHDRCHLLFSPELDDIVPTLSELVNDSPVEPPTERVLMTMLFTDIVASTARVAAIGDRRWGVELDHHDDAVRRHLDRFGGREIKSLGDGVFAAFDAPSRAVGCALAIQHELGRRCIAVRAGVHIGEVERRGDDIVGINVHIAQRICALAAGDQVLVSQQIVDLAAGSGLRFEGQGEVTLRGLTDKIVVHVAVASS
jgi:class 3 adenylate cyclase/pimeloyl-ACP methyl ester carboxylesterase